jgi:hypothetical protein
MRIQGAYSGVFRNFLREEIAITYVRTVVLDFWSLDSVETTERR